MLNFAKLLLTGGVNVAIDIFDQAIVVVTAFIDLLLAVLSGVTTLFWVSGTGLTVLGILGVTAMGIGIVYFGFNLVMKLMRPRG
jgi:hypothetical protein